MAKEHILIIDDDTHIRNACTEFLRMEGYQVSSAESGEKGVEILRDSQYNLIITDFKMPGIDGLEVLRYAKSNYPKTDVIIITAHGTIENAVEAMRLGAYDYITKNFDLVELELIIERCMEKQRLSAEVSELKELVNLYEVSKAISSLMGIDELLNLILRLVCDTLSADGGSIMLYDTETNELSVKVALGSRRDVVIGKKLVLGERIAGYAAKEEHMVSIQGQLKNDSRFAQINEFDTFESSITAPLHRKGKLLGVINLNRKENDVKFSQRDERLLSIFAVEAAIAIENTNLFNTLEQEKDELNAIFTNMVDGAIATDAGFSIIRLNRSAEELLGVSHKESPGRNLSKVIFDFEPSVSWKEIKEQSERTISFELVRKKGKTLILGVLATKIYDQGDNLIGHIMVLRNITDEKKEERHKIDFLNLMSHKLKTPLTAINGFSSLLADSMKDLDDKSTYALHAIKEKGFLLNELVDELLRFTLLESEYTQINIKQVNVSAILEKCLKGLVDFTKSNSAEITIDPDLAQLPSVYIDSMKIIEVLQNLIENSIKFNNKERKLVRITGRCVDRQFVVLEVTDNGLGIPSEEHNNLFQKFYQIEEHRTGQIKGAGLGLALVKRIIELHGGKVWVKSTIGEGSTFSLTLPITLPENLRSDPNEP